MGERRIRVGIRGEGNLREGVKGNWWRGRERLKREIGDFFEDQACSIHSAYITSINW